MTVRLDGIGDIIRDSSLPTLTRYKLVREHTRAMCVQYKSQLDVALGVAGHKHKVSARIAVAALDTYEKTMLLQIQGELVRVLADIGVRVAESEWAFYADFGVRMRRFKTGLARLDIDGWVVEMILARVDETCRQFFEIIGNRAKQLIEQAQV